MKFHRITYFSENSKYFQKPLILQAVQWYSRITAIAAMHILIWSIGSWLGSSIQRFCTKILPLEERIYAVNKKVATNS